MKARLAALGFACGGPPATDPCAGVRDDPCQLSKARATTDPVAAWAHCRLAPAWKNCQRWWLADRAGSFDSPAQVSAFLQSGSGVFQMEDREFFWQVWSRQAKALDPVACPETACKTAMALAIRSLLSTKAQAAGPTLCMTEPHDDRLSPTGNQLLREVWQTECARRAATPAGVCAAGMVGIPTHHPTFCVDRFELTYGSGLPAQGRAGVTPAEHITFRQASGLCSRRNARLCTTQEWMDACDGWPGPGGRLFPWGDLPHAGQCPLGLPAGGPTTHIQHSGTWPQCITEEGTADLVGNLWEWVDPQLPPDVPPRAGKIGGSFYTGAERGDCFSPPDTSHPIDFEGSIGLRCCGDPSAHTAPLSAPTHGG